MKRTILTICALTLLLSAAASAATVKTWITADDYFFAWMDPESLSSSSFNLNWTNHLSEPPTIATWGTPIEKSINLDNGQHSLYIRAWNYPLDATVGGANPAALLAKIDPGNGSLLVTNDSAWEFYVGVDPLGAAANQWHTAKKMAEWNGGEWGNFIQPGDALSNTYSGTGAQWIWSDPTTASSVWFRTEFTAVPEPMSVVLGCMGLSSVAGFRRLRRK